MLLLLIRISEVGRRSNPKPENAKPSQRKWYEMVICTLDYKEAVISKRLTLCT